MGTRDDKGSLEQLVHPGFEVTLVHQAHRDSAVNEAELETLVTRALLDSLAVRGQLVSRDQLVLVGHLALLALPELLDRLGGRAVQVFRARWVGLEIKVSLVHLVL